jgi:hypothetical protein
MTGFEVADYNVMANYAIAANAAIGTVPTGAMRKFGCREATFVGTWVAPTIDAISFNGGLDIRTITSGSYVEYSFWGTGVEFRTFFATSGAYSQTYSIDGSTNLSAYTAALITTTTGISFTPATGALAGTASGSNPGLIRITGLPLGLHKIKVLSNSVAILRVDAFDVITPIHINDSSLRVGSQSIKSVAKFSPEKVQSNAGPNLSGAKAWISFGDSEIFSSYNVSAIVKVQNYVYDIFLEKPMKSSKYVAVGSGQGVGSATNDGIQIDIISMKNNVLRIGATYNTGGGSGNEWTSLPVVMNIVFFGELFDE